MPQTPTPTPVQVPNMPGPPPLQPIVDPVAPPVIRRPEPRSTVVPASGKVPEAFADRVTVVNQNKPNPLHHQVPANTGFTFGVGGNPTPNK